MQDYNLKLELLATFCIGGTLTMLLCSIRALIKELIRRSDEKSEERKEKYRAYYQKKYMKEYLIRKHREELFESEVVVNDFSKR